MDGPVVLSMPPLAASQKSAQTNTQPQPHAEPTQVGTVSLYGIHIVSLIIEGQERLCLAQISNTLLKQFSYNEIHNRRVALGITCVQCTPVQLEILRKAGAMPPSSRRCGMITRREAERLCKSFLSDNAPPRLPEDFAFSVHHECSWGCRGAFLPSRYNSSRAKCIKCTYCGLFFSPNKFIFHSHRTRPTDKYVQPDAANFNSWRRHMKLSGNPPDDVVHAWEDVKAMFNGGTRKRLLSKPSGVQNSQESVVHGWDEVKTIFSATSRKRGMQNNSGNTRESPTSPSKRSRLSPTVQPQIPGLPNISPSTISAHQRVPPFPELPLPLPRSIVMDYVWHQHQHAAAAAVAAAKTPGFAFPSYAIPWLAKRSPVLFPGPLPPPLTGTPSTEPLMNAAVAAPLHQSAFRPVIRSSPIVEPPSLNSDLDNTETSPINVKVDSDDEVDIETMEDDEPQGGISSSNLNSGIQNNLNNVKVNNSGNSSNHSGRSASPQCWSPARETEREAEKIAEEAAALRDIKPEVNASKSLESWHGSAFYQHLNIIKGTPEVTDRETPDCTACRPRGMFYTQDHSPPASTN